MKNVLSILFITLFSIISFGAVGSACEVDFLGGTDMIIVSSKQATTSFSIPEKFIEHGVLIVPLHVVVEQNGKIVYETYTTQINIVLPALKNNGMARITIQLQDYVVKKQLF